jgi:hypothetical protein
MFRNKKNGKSKQKQSSAAVVKYRELRTNDLLTYNGFCFPPRFRTHLKYHEMWRDTTAGGITNYLYRGNGVFDPYAGVGGTACYGIDQFQELYGWVKAHNSTITVRAVNTGSEPVSLYLYDCYGSAAPTVHTAISAPRVKTALVNVDAGKAVVLKATSGITRFTASPQDITWGSSLTANPSLMWYWKIFANNVGLSALALYLSVTIDYDCEFSLRTELDDVDA